MQSLATMLRKLHLHNKAILLSSHFLLIFYLPAAWFKSIWLARILLDGRWSCYMGFRPKNALNSFFYRTQWLNIDRYGRNGCCPVAGLGNYPLSRWAHISSLSHYVYANAGAVSTLMGTLVWVLGHLIWGEEADAWWVLLITTTLLLSTTAYAMAFVYQNYNILGWLWMPIALFAVMSGYWIIAALAWFAASLASVTVVFVAVPLMAVHVLTTGNYEAIWVLIPAVIKVSMHALPILVDGNLKAGFMNLGKLIGIFPVGVRYRRRPRWFGRFNIYFVLLYFSGCATLWYVHGTAPSFPLTAMALFLINQYFIRFADHQSVILLFVTVIAAYTMMMPPGLVEWVVFFLVVSPLPFLFGIIETDIGTGTKRIMIYAPFNHAQIEQGCDALFEKVPAGSRVLFAFNDPCGVYEQIFDGYRITIEPFLFVAARRGIHLFPDWYAVAETNYSGAPQIWGRSLSEVETNLKYWSAGYVLYYQTSGKELPVEWLTHFEVVSSYDWSGYLDTFRGALPWSNGKPCPIFMLLKPRV